MAGSRYVHITQEEFENFMKSNLFECINPDQGRGELVYAFMWGDGDYALKVYSSIVPGSGGRGVGADAIRTVLLARTKQSIHNNSTYPVWKAKRVHRTKNWKVNLQQRIDEGLERGCEDVENWKCPQCNSPFVLRDGKHGKFYSCSAWPVTGCNCTADYNK
jgi:hypothetical protein